MSALVSGAYAVSHIVRVVLGGHWLLGHCLTDGRQGDDGERAIGLHAEPTISGPLRRHRLAHRGARGDAIEVREKSKSNPTILAARDATAHAPSPNWLEVDRDALKGRVLQQPKREELVQIQLNEQLIVELYSK